MKFNPIALLLGATMLVSASFANADVVGEARDHAFQGMAFANMRDFNNAILEFKASINLKPTAQAYSNLGVSYLQLGKNNLALQALKNAEALDSNDNLVLYNMAATYSLSDDTDLALEYLDKALQNGFNNYDAVRFDPDLSNARGETAEFRAILEKNKIFIQ